MPQSSAASEREGAGVNMMVTREQRRQLERDNEKLPDALVKLPVREWPSLAGAQVEVWRSRAYLVQVFDERNGVTRLSVCRTSLNGDRWQDNISWDDLQRLKRECGRGNLDAVEVYPNDADVVNVANMRHLWIFQMPLAFPWRRGA